jgi:hypothetical protein
MQPQYRSVIDHMQARVWKLPAIIEKHSRAIIIIVSNTGYPAWLL